MQRILYRSISAGMRRCLLGMTLIGVLFISGCTAGPEDAESPISMPEFTDFATLQRPSSPNSRLIAPAQLPLRAKVDDVAPVFGIPADQLASAWQGMVESQPRTRIIGRSADGLRIEVEQRSAVFGFVDRISFEAVPIDDRSSSLLAYSRSLVGYWDVGVNRRRLDAWFAALAGGAARD